MRFDSYLLNLADNFISYLIINFRINKIITLGFFTLLLVLFKILSNWQAGLLLDFMDFVIIGLLLLSQIAEQYYYNNLDIQGYNTFMSVARKRGTFIRIFILTSYTIDLISSTCIKFLPYTAIFDILILILINTYISYTYIVPMPPKRKREMQKSSKLASETA